MKPKQPTPCDDTCRHGGQRPVVEAPKSSATLPRPKPLAGTERKDR